MKLIFCTLGACYCTLLAVETTAMAIFAQRQGNELGACATGMCCLDIRLPVVPWYVAVPILIIAIVFFVLAGMGEAQRQKEIEESNEEVKKRNRWLLNCRVRFDNNEGVVVHQEGVKCYVNWLNQRGNLVQSIKYESDLTIVE